RRRDTQTEESLIEGEENPRDAENVDETDNGTDDLRYQLSWIAEENAMYLQSPIIGKSISEKTNRELPPSSVHTVHIYSSNRIVNLQDFFDDACKEDYIEASNSANDTCKERTHVATWCSDRNQA